MAQIVQSGAGPHDAEDTAAIMRLPAAQPAAAPAISYLPDSLELEVVCPDDGWLLVTDRWSRGWKATVNSRPAEVFGGNLVYRAVCVKAGSNDVRFSYEPKGWPLLLVVSWGTVALVLMGLRLRPTSGRTKQIDVRTPQSLRRPVGIPDLDDFDTRHRVGGL